MSAAAEKIRNVLSALSEDDRAELARFLIASLDEGVDSKADAAWEKELELRAAEIKSGRAAGEPAAKVFSELRKKHAASRAQRF